MKTCEVYSPAEIMQMKMRGPGWWCVSWSWNHEGRYPGVPYYLDGDTTVLVNPKVCTNCKYYRGHEKNQM